MNSYWYRYRFAEEWRTWNERLRKAAQGVDSVALVQSLHGASLELLQEGEYEPAVELLERAIAVARRLGDRSLEARGLNSLGVALIEIGDRRSARAHLDASLALARANGEPRREATVLANLVVLDIEDGDFEASLQAALAGIAIDRAHGDIWSVTLNEINMTPAVAAVPHAAHAHLCEVAERVAIAGDDDLMADLFGPARAPAGPGGGVGAIGAAGWDEQLAAGAGLGEAAALTLAAEPLPADASVPT